MRSFSTSQFGRFTSSSLSTGRPPRSHRKPLPVEVSASRSPSPAGSKPSYANAKPFTGTPSDRETTTQPATHRGEGQLSISTRTPRVLMICARVRGGAAAWSTVSCMVSRVPGMWPPTSVDRAAPCRLSDGSKLTRGDGSPARIAAGALKVSPGAMEAGPGRRPKDPASPVAGGCRGRTSTGRLTTAA